MKQIGAARLLPLSSISLLASATAAHAAIVYTTSPISAGPESTTPWDIDGDSANDTVLFDINTTMPITAVLGGIGVGAGSITHTGFAMPVSMNSSYPFAVAQNTGESISSVDFLSNTSTVGIFSFQGVHASGFADGESAYIGYAFKPGTEGVINYGWARVTPDYTNHVYTIHEWAYEDSGDPIQVGAVPEPAETAIGLGALALGAAGLRHWRKQRKAA